MNAAALPLAALLCACLALYAVRADHDSRRRAGLLLGRRDRPSRPGGQWPERLAAALAALVRGARAAGVGAAAGDGTDADPAEAPRGAREPGRTERGVRGTPSTGARVRRPRGSGARRSGRKPAGSAELGAAGAAPAPSVRARAGSVPNRRGARAGWTGPVGFGPSEWSMPGPRVADATDGRVSPGAQGLLGAHGLRWGRPGLPALGAGAVGVVLGIVTRSPVPVLAGLASVPLVGRMVDRRAARAGAERAAAAVAALCSTLAADLRAGRPPHVALADAVEAARWPGSAEFDGAARVLLSAARFGGDVPQALRTAAGRREGLHGLAAVAACWQVAVDGGAGLAAALDRVAGALRAEADQRDDLRAQLAGPRSTAVLLALLPVFGLVLGSGLGADPSAVLLHTPAGLGCLVAGVLLECAGLAWTARIIRTAEGRPS